MKTLHSLAALCIVIVAIDFLNELENCGNGEDSDRETREDGEGEGVRRRRRERSGEREEEYSQEQKEAVDRYALTITSRALCYSIHNV